MKREVLFIAFAVLYITVSSGQSGFFTQNWLEFEGRINNNKQTGERTRVNDRGMSTHPVYSKRFEGQVNGLALLAVYDTILNIEKAELFCELWGGHPHTANKRFQVNGGRVYNLPSEKTAAGNCEYLFPSVPIDHRELVTGMNGIQFVCDRGATFWGHFLMEEIAVNCYYRPDAPFIKRAGLAGFRAIPQMKEKEILDEAVLSLGFDNDFVSMISEVHYFGFYLGYDWNGSGIDTQWHGYLLNRKWTGHIGSSTEAPFSVKWDASLIPSQGRPMAVKALIVFRNGINCWSDVLEGVTFSPERPEAMLVYCSEMPVPFWSRDKQLRTAKIELSTDPKYVEEAFLLTRIWDGGEGSVNQPFKMNGIPYKITAGNAPHKLVSTVNRVLPGNIVRGANHIELYSDTEHHGIEICLPGPALLLRYKKQK